MSGRQSKRLRKAVKYGVSKVVNKSRFRRLKNIYNKLPWTEKNKFIKAMAAINLESLQNIATRKATPTVSQ